MWFASICKVRFSSSITPRRRVSATDGPTDSIPIGLPSAFNRRIKYFEDFEKVEKLYCIENLKQERACLKYYSPVFAEGKIFVLVFCKCRIYSLLQKTRMKVLPSATVGQ